MTEELMKFTKVELIKMISGLKEKKKKQPGQNYPIQPLTPFGQMGKLEYCRWRVNLVTHRILNDNNVHDNLYIDSEKRYRVKMMKEFCKWFVELKKEDANEAKKFQDLYDKYLIDIKSELKIIPKIPSIKLNSSGR